MRVLIPAKALRAAKRRLAPCLTPEERAGLSLWMLDRVLCCCREAGLSETYLVGGDERTADLGRRRGARLLPELGFGLNQTLERALAAVRGEEACLVVVADLPLLRPEELVRLIRPWQERRTATLAPSRDGGTNALLLPPACPFTPSFGPGSARRHRAQLVAAGFAVEEVCTPGLLHDVDRPEDLTVEVRSLGGFPIPRLLDVGSAVVESCWDVGNAAVRYPLGR
ncbi:MAG: 2-phospho-L-lactate guanylyltransferase [Armatimonadota bacterium]|nr:2-phospho-L-lactate guanylyltransferase [Armatimonadota bacterium]MDR7438308.1 2-phospho-L-lactate guanylyltransferase [Armatimonadota bacterium]MDR7443370.1 2-phospho-L-lactate guanylyltransferase [Armatimonadota bacterium]MDR7563892.1 2-phospho-L-lactate guanylyltransferase [Armatimonadota bacterium]MDR7567255.1 2-phospho-L-lactate guanylyltransferase [Armatimonadota bacterium]